MPNLYGVSNPVVSPQFTFPGGNVNCPAGTRTVVIQTNPIIAVSAGVYYPVVYAWMAIQFGSTVPTALSVSVAQGGGSDMQAVALPSFLFISSGNVGWPFLLWGTPSENAWKGAGTAVQLVVNPTTQAVTIQSAGAYMQTFLFRAPDQ